MSKGKLNKRVLLLLLVLIMTFTIAACGQTPIDTQEPSNNEEQIEENNSEIKELIVIDHLGREVKLEKPAEKIVSGYYITTSMLIALGLEENVVGIEAKADTRPIYKLAARHFLDLPNVGTMKEFDLEGAAALEPDLVILSIRLKDAAESLEQLGIKVLTVNPESMEELKETIEMISKLTNTEDRAEELIKYYDDKTSELSAKIKDKEKKNVYLAGNSSLLSTATMKMYQNSLIEMAGGENVAGDIDDTYWAEISYEQLIVYNPDVIIGIPGAVYTKDEILNDEKLQGINAVKNNKVYFMPDSFESWDSPVPSGILGTMWATSLLNEDDYPFDVFKQDVYDFYKEFYDIEINMEQITK
jgi:iron complex transport system substrate-binding protein